MSAINYAVYTVYIIKKSLLKLDELEMCSYVNMLVSYSSE